ncbi:YbaN family protein [Sphingomonas sp. ID0503]|uniref:YbaN family protein n=1 Tax=Sphingomonas sp. ID0503 TaxID=3399691 RepID=UPI003AFA3811
MMRLVYLALGLLAVALGVIGVFLPLLPTVPFLILAAFCFARANPAWERRLLEHPRFGPPIRAWREHGAIGRAGKTGAVIGLTGSAVIGLFVLPGLWRFLPLTVAVACGAWILSRPSR